MIKFSSWARVIITWVVITSTLLLSYLFLRNPSMKLEMLSLAMNFVATTSIYYIYMNLSQDGDETTEGGTSPAKTADNTSGLYKLNFGPLIEDMGVWLSLFFLLYNIVPVTLYVHTWMMKNL